MRPSEVETLWFEGIGIDTRFPLGAVFLPPQCQGVNPSIGGIMLSAYIERHGSYNHGVSEKVEWRVRLTHNHQIVRICKTRKEAQVWQAIYTDKEKS
jgi:hypothetical protein